MPGLFLPWSPPAVRRDVGPDFSQLDMIRERNKSIAAVGKRVPKVRKARRSRFPLALERGYAADLKERIEVMRRAVNEILIPLLPRIQQEAKAIRRDDYTDVLRQAIELATAQTFQLNGGEQTTDMLAQLQGENVSDFNKTDQIAIMRAAVGVDVFASDPALLPKLKGFARANSQKIKSLEESVWPEIERLVLQETELGTRVEDIQAQIQERFNVTRSRAELLARDQTGKLNGDLSKLRQVEIGVQEYRWHTVEDDRVRATHRSKNNKVFRWDTPPPGTGHPGNDFQCRCFAEPLLAPVVAP